MTRFRVHVEFNYNLTPNSQWQRETLDVEAETPENARKSAVAHFRNKTGEKGLVSVVKTKRLHKVGA